MSQNSNGKSPPNNILSYKYPPSILFEFNGVPKKKDPLALIKFNIM